MSVDPILNSYLNGGPAGGVYSAVNLNLYGYCWGNPIRYIDPDGRSIYEAMLILIKIDKDLNEAWNKSFHFNKDGTIQYVQENGGIVVTKTVVPEVYVKNKKTGAKYYGFEDTASISINHAKSEGEKEVADFHTHPYLELYEGIPFSMADLITAVGAAYFYGTKYKIVEAGSKRFVLEIIDKEKFAQFILNTEESELNKIFFGLVMKEQESYNNPEAHLSEIYTSALSKFLASGDSGVIFYQTTDKKKVKLEEVK